MKVVRPDSPLSPEPPHDQPEAVNTGGRERGSPLQIGKGDGGTPIPCPITVPFFKGVFRNRRWVRVDIAIPDDGYQFFRASVCKPGAFFNGVFSKKEKLSLLFFWFTLIFSGTKVSNTANWSR